ncbi:glycosyltransferase family 2 protein [Gramella sp. BOM4]|nr:glycosyltransferase family 2 protein [Christiangramia bathymodioli]
MKSGSSIKLSVAIVTRNRPDSLYQTLRSLAQQNIKPYELIISDDSNKEELKVKIKRLAAAFNCKYFEGPKNGLYANRNFIAKKCKGTHFRTMDDDHLFPPNHLAECLKAIETEPETIWTIGEYYPENVDRPLPPPVPGQLHPRGFSVVPKNLNNYFGISCGGTIYPIKVVKDMVLNFEQYKFGKVYLEYGARLKRLGYKIKFLPSTYLIHNDIQTTASELSSKIICESRIFAMFCLSFGYQNTVSNKLQTLGQIAFEIIFSRYGITEVLNAYKNYKLATKL